MKRRLTKAAVLRRLAGNCNELGFPPTVRIRRGPPRLELQLDTCGGPRLVVPLAAITLELPRQSPSLRED